MLPFKDILDLLPQFVVLLDGQGVVQYANHSSTQRFGPLLGKKCCDIFHSSEPCPVCRTLSSRQSVHCELDSCRVETRYLVYDESPQVLICGQDALCNEQVAAGGGSVENRYRTIADFTYDWEYWMGTDGSLLYNSPSCQRITGRVASDFIKDVSLLEEIVHPDDRKRVHDHLRQECHSRRKVASLEYRILTPEGKERWIGHVCQPVFDESGNLQGRRASNRDNTAQKKTEQALLHAERLATIGRMVASLAHEINNPLQSMTNSLELVLNFPLEAEERHSYLVGMQQEMERLQEIAGGILNLARQKQIHLKTTSLPLVLLKSLNVARDHIRRYDIHTEVMSEGKIPDVQASPDQIEQVFLNIIINAVESMENGGSLSITLRNGKKFVEIEFADTGVGIPPEEMDFIFDPFYTTKVHGTGLGLAVSRRIAMQHGGDITCRNRPQGGAVFTVVLAVQPKVLSYFTEKFE